MKEKQKIEYTVQKHTLAPEFIIFMITVVPNAKETILSAYM